MNIDTTHAAIVAYFDGERREMLVILAGCALALMLAAALYVVAKDSFSTGFGVLVLIAALGLAWTSLSLLRRDSVHQVQMIESAKGVQAKQTLGTEAARVDGVISNYKYYRFAAVALSALALIGVALTRNHTIHGVAAGLLLLAAAQLVVDHYSEQRARAYAHQLGGST